MEQREQQYLWVHLRTWRPSLAWRAEPSTGGITLQTGCVLMQLALSPDILNPHFKPQPLNFTTLPKACHRHDSFTGGSSMSQSYRAPQVGEDTLPMGSGTHHSQFSGLFLPLFEALLEALLKRIVRLTFL